MARNENTTQGDVSALAGGRALTEAEILAQIPGARARAAKEQKHGLRADAVRYSVAHEQLILELTNGTTIGVPVRIVPALRAASDRELAEVEVTPTGSALHWERLGVDLSVPALVREALGGGALQSLFGAAGGQATSSRKAEAARANGAKGGRPRGSGAKKSGTSRSTHQKAERQRSNWFVDSDKAGSGPGRELGVAAKHAGKVAAKRAEGPRAAAAKSSGPSSSRSSGSKR